MNLLRIVSLKGISQKHPRLKPCDIHQELLQYTTFIPQVNRKWDCSKENPKKKPYVKKKIVRTGLVLQENQLGKVRIGVI